MLKRLKNIEDLTDELLLVIKDSKDNKDSQLGIKSIDYDIKKKFSPEGHQVFKAIVNQEKKINYKYFNMTPSPKNHFDFRMFLALKPFFNTIYFGEVLIPAIERDQIGFNNIIEKLKNYSPRTKTNIKDKSNTLTSAQNLYD